MRIADKLIFWVKPECREAKLAYLLGCTTVTGFIRVAARGTNLKLHIENMIDTIMTEMGLDRESTLRAIANLWDIKISITRKGGEGANR